MNVQKTTVTKYTIANVKGLDQVSVFAESFGGGRGKITVECYGESWAAYWGAMGCETVEEFLVTSDNDYVVGKLSRDPRNVIDYAAIASECGIDREIDPDNLLYYEDDLAMEYGGDWRMNLPTKRNPKHLYLSKIVSAIKEAFGQPQ